MTEELDWNHTSLIVAKIHNVNCVKRQDMKEADFFNPYRKAARGGAGAPIRTRDDFLVQKELIQRR